MNPDDRANLKRILASFDEPGLVALANKGLVRRAQKDLEAGGLSATEEETTVVVRGPDWSVTMPPEGPTRATDSTKASGITRQILMATMYLREYWNREESPIADCGLPIDKPEPQTADDAGALEQALLAVTMEDLEKWAGKTTVREAVPLVRNGMAVEVEAHAGLTLRLVGQEVEARLLPGKRKSAGKMLDDVLTTAPRSQHTRWVVVAVLAFQQSRGRTIELTRDAVPAEIEGAPLTRQELLASARELLTGLAATGLAHPSERMRERLFTLSVSAGAVHLPRLARLLRALADDVDLVLARSAAADTGRLFDRLCLAHALVRGLAGPQPAAALVGAHRTQYDPVGDLALTGVGAHPWQTASGYEGVTVLFWDGPGKRFLTWTASRPTSTPGRFDMTQTYRHDAVWSGGGSPERLSRSRFTLHQAKTNVGGRLSTSQSTSVGGLEAAQPDQLDFNGRLFTRWSSLRDYACGTYAVGLRETNPLNRLVVLQPAVWGERVFDELQQEFCWQLADDAGDRIVLQLPWNGVNESSIQFLEAVNPDRDKLVRVVVRLLVGDRLSIEPLSLLSRGTPQGQRVLNPAFDQALITSKHSDLLDKLRAKYGRDRVPTTMTADDEDEAEGAGPSAQLPPVLRARLSEAEGLLLQLAESGMRRLSDPLRQRVRTLATSLDRLGLTELGAALHELEQAENGAEQVIRGGYLCRLYRQVIAARVQSGV